MEITIWGVRGSIPAPGPETIRYGGNTLCVEVRTATGKLVILDAGTGLTAFGNQLLGSEFGKGQGEAINQFLNCHFIGSFHSMSVEGCSIWRLNHVCFRLYKTGDNTISP